MFKQLEAIGYLTGSREGTGRTGVTRHRKERVAPGLNLYTSGHMPGAVLMDMNGTPIHQWVKGFYDIWPGVVWFVIYAVGLIAAVYHFANGLCTFCITWGITVGVGARKRVSVAATGLGAVMLIWGLLSLAAFRFHQDEPPEQVADVAARSVPAAHSYTLEAASGEH